jgi:DNA/RNA-binding domain of Phe-tRNA-synthetase-like protein
MTESTTDAVLVVEGLPPVRKKEVEEILNDLGQLVVKHCGGKNRQSVLDRQTPALEL